MATILTGPVLATAPGDSTKRHASAVVSVGSRGYSEDGEFVFVGAVGTIASGAPVGTATSLSACVAGDLGVAEFVGVADAAFASGEFGYVRVKGPVECVVESGAAAGGLLQLSATAGKLKALTTSGQQVAQAVDAADDASTAAVTIHVTNGW